MCFGSAILPVSRSWKTLVSDIERMLHNAFENRVLPFDSEAACAYADIYGKHTGYLTVL